MTTLDINTIAARAAAWRLSKWPDCTKEQVLAKATEELGEVARAFVGELENREGRGDAPSECGDLILVVSSIVPIFYPMRNLSGIIAETMREVGA